MGGLGQRMTVAHTGNTTQKVECNIDIDLEIKTS